jgi:uncharacterized protein with HEPN domain
MATSNPERRFQDILDNIERIGQHLQHLEPDETLEENPLVLDAVERCLQRISEAARKLDWIADELLPDFPWSNVRGIGNHLRHDYDRLSMPVINVVIEKELPALRTACLQALEKLGRR